MTELVVPNVQIEIFGDEHVGLAWTFQVNPNSCGNAEHYEQYLRLCAIDDKNRGLGVTYILLGNDQIAGFITLKATSFVQCSSTGSVVSGEPAIEITQLAVDKRFERQGYGSLLVGFAVGKAIQLNEREIGVKYVVLCSDPASVAFYCKEELGFQETREYWDIPREHWNTSCVPLVLQLQN